MGVRYSLTKRPDENAFGPTYDRVAARVLQAQSSPRPAKVKPDYIGHMTEGNPPSHHLIRMRRAQPSSA